MNLVPVPKPSRAIRLAAQELKRRARRAQRQHESRQRQRLRYGMPRESVETWPGFEKRIKARDGYRCIMGCPPWFGLAVHHWYRTVGAGGKSVDWQCCTLCGSCHYLVHAGHLPRELIRAKLLFLYGVAFFPPEGAPR